jgi:excisionase family DNA binding protein
MNATKSLSPQQAQQEYFPSIGRNTLYRFIREGRIPHIRLGRKILIPRSALERWLENAAAGYQAS